MKFYVHPNWGENLEYEVPEQDILQARPAPLSLEDLEILEIDPPPWAVGAICKLGGRRHDKRCIVPVNWHATSHGVAGAYSPHTPHQPFGAYNGPLANPVPNGSYDRAIERRNRKKGASNDVPAARKAAPPGNLREEEYRFWKGFAVGPTGGAFCRWCETHCSDRNDMHKHHLADFCKERLLALYKYAKQQSRQRYCFACKKQTSGMRWGLPLCNTVACISRWKFFNKPAWHGFAQYAQWAMEAQMADPTNGPYASLSEDPSLGH